MIDDESSVVAAPVPDMLPTGTRGLEFMIAVAYLDKRRARNWPGEQQLTRCRKHWCSSPHDAGARTWIMIGYGRCTPVPR